MDEKNSVYFYCKQCGCNYGHLISCENYNENKLDNPSHYVKSENYYNPDFNEYMSK